MAECSSVCSVSFSVSHSRLLCNVNNFNYVRKSAQRLIPRCSRCSRCSMSRVQFPALWRKLYSNPTDFSCLLLFLNKSSTNVPMSASTSIDRTRLGRPLMRICSGKREEDDNISDEFGLYPWDSAFENDAIEWVQEDTITLFTTEGLIRIGGSLVPHHINVSDKKQGRMGVSHKNRRFQEENYMDPEQGLCLGAVFDIAATNGLDLGRRFCVFGFCRSIEMLSDVVEDTVLEQGGEVVAAEKESRGGLQEKLRMTVAVPLLWGIPPAADRLHFAIRTGGGIVEKVYWQWNFQ